MTAAEQITIVVMFNVFVVPGLIFAAFLLRGKGADLIAGFNTASPGERAKWDEKALCRGVGVLLLLLMGCIEFACMGVALDIPALMWFGDILFIPIAVGGVAYINKSKRFKRRNSK